MNEDEDAKYGAVAALISFAVIVLLVVVIGVSAGAWTY